MRSRLSRDPGQGRRRGVGLIEVTVASALLAVAATVILQMVQTNTSIIGGNRDHMFVRTQADSSSAYWEAYPFRVLERLFSGHELDPSLVEEMMVPLEDDQLEVRGVRPQGYAEDHRFHRMMGMGLLQTRVRWRNHRGFTRVHDLPRLVIEEGMFRPVDVPATGSQLMDRAAQAMAGGGAGSSGSEDSARLGTQLMEMLHDLHHAGEDIAEQQDLVTRVASWARLGDEQASRGAAEARSAAPAANAGGAGGLDQLAARAQRRFRTGQGRTPGVDDLLAVLESRRIPDGDYAFEHTVEDAPGLEDERLLLLYRLTHLVSRERYVLAKVVDQGRDAPVVRVEGREVVDLGDRALHQVSLPDALEPVELSGAFAHLEVTTRRLYVYRGTFDRDGHEVPLRPVLQIRSFPDELIGDGDRPLPGDELDEALEGWRADLGLGSERVDGREAGVDTKVLYSW